MYLLKHLRFKRDSGVLFGMPFSLFFGIIKIIQSLQAFNSDVTDVPNTDVILVGKHELKGPTIGIGVPYPRC